MARAIAVTKGHDPEQVPDVQPIIATPTGTAAMSGVVDDPDRMARIAQGQKDHAGVVQHCVSHEPTRGRFAPLTERRTR